jgi:abequosyltransferase
MAKHTKAWIDAMRDEPLLSICIATYKRADYIGQTLASIVPQLCDGTELIVFDGASPDHTAEVVGRFVEANPQVRYVRAETNSGIDQDFDTVVGLARGEHCWLFADDDLILPGAVDRVLAELKQSGPDVLVVNSEVRDRDLRRLLEPSRMSFSGRRVYGPGDGDAMLADTGNALSFIGCAIIRRSWWLSRNRADYYGTLFVHVGVVFQQPGCWRGVAISEPLVSIRLGNAMWTGRAFEIWMFMWPALIWGLEGYSDKAKAAVTPREPWRNAARLLLARAGGGLGRQEYHRFAPRLDPGSRLIAAALLALPGGLANLFAVALLGVRGLGTGSGMYNIVATSPHAGRLTRRVARAFGQTSSLEDFR